MMNSRKSAWIAVSFFVATAGTAQALGQAPHHAPGEEPPLSHAVAGFSVPENSQAFLNYGIWEHSHLPATLQLFHCAGMALFARQVFNFGSFDPSLPKVSAQEYHSILSRIFKVPTPTLPCARAKIVIPGYAGFNEMTRQPEIEGIVKNLLGDAINDIFRPNWNWSPLDVFGSTHRSRSLIELAIRESVSRDELATIYLTDGFKTAHSVLAYGYEVLEDRVRYTVYDSNHPDAPEQMDFVFANAKFDHPDLGLRDPWILHPYSNEFANAQ